MNRLERGDKAEETRRSTDPDFKTQITQQVDRHPGKQSLLRKTERVSDEPTQKSCSASPPCFTTLKQDAF